jgi:hypothetical protein
VTTLNARANQAWNEIEPVKNDWDPMPFYGQQEAFEEGWETGYKAAAEERAVALRERVAEVLGAELPPGYKFEAYILADALLAAGVFRESAVPQPVDQEALEQLAAEWRQSADEDERYLNRAHASEIHDVYASIRINREHADAVLAVLAGEQEQVEP